MWRVLTANEKIKENFNLRLSYQLQKDGAIKAYYFHLIVMKKPIITNVLNM